MADAGELYVGTAVDGGQRVVIDADDLTTHGVIVGMTGSGKTGLGVVAIEEALLAGVPTLVIDPKGDMANLCLRFPGMTAADVLPWVDAGLAAREGTTPAQLAEATATTWREGVDGSGITADQVARLAAIPTTVYTPGATTGIPLDLVGSLSAPVGADEAARTDEAIDTASGLLALVGVEADPLTGREHILLTNLLTTAWAQGHALDVPTLITQVQQPPMRKLGVMDLETFFPSADRTALAMKLNGLLASPTFAAWAHGVPLDVDRMLSTADGGPRCAVVSLSHLDDRERQFVVNLGSSIPGGFLGGRSTARGVAADLRRAAGERGRTSRTRQRLDTAQGAVVDATDDLQVLEDELAADLPDIDARWVEAAGQIEEVEVGLEEADVDVAAIALVWVPAAR